MTDRDDLVAAPARVAAAAWTGLLDTAPEEAFDRLTRLASVLTGAPMVFLSVLDARRSFLKSVIGAGRPSNSERSMPVEESFCRHVVAADAEYVVEDVAHDPSTATIPALDQWGVAAWTLTRTLTRMECIA